jgi:hypothetical protein
MAYQTKFTGAAKKRYLRQLARTNNVDSACASAGVTRETVRVHRSDPLFKQDEEDARQAFCDTLEAEAVRRGRDGIFKPVFYQGERVDNDEVREYSDVILLALLKRHIPEYRDRSTVDHNIPCGVLIVAGRKSTDEWAAQDAGAKPDTPGHKS